MFRVHPKIWLDWIQWWNRPAAENLPVWNSTSILFLHHLQTRSTHCDLVDKKNKNRSLGPGRHSGLVNTLYSQAGTFFLMSPPTASLSVSFSSVTEFSIGASWFFLLSISSNMCHKHGGNTYFSWSSFPAVGLWSCVELYLNLFSIVRQTFLSAKQGQNSLGQFCWRVRKWTTLKAFIPLSSA